MKTYLVARKSTAKPGSDEWYSILRRGKTEVEKDSSHSDKPSRSSNPPNVCKMNASVSSVNRYKTRPRNRSHHLTIQKIQQYQKSTELVISKLEFQRMVAEISTKTLNSDCKFQAGALSVLQEAAEKYIVQQFETKNLNEANKK